MLLQPPRDDAVATDPERVRAAIARLPPAERDLLVLRFADDLATDEVAALLGTDPATVLRRLRHAAWLVEDLAGVSPAFDGPTPRRLVGRPAVMVEEEAAAGITPLLAARLAAAVAGEPPAADGHWRLHAAVRRVRQRSDGVLTALLVAALALPAVSLVRF